MASSGSAIGLVSLLQLSWASLSQGDLPSKDILALLLSKVCDSYSSAPRLPTKQSYCHTCLTSQIMSPILTSSPPPPPHTTDHPVPPILAPSTQCAGQAWDHLGAPRPSYRPNKHHFPVCIPVPLLRSLNQEQSHTAPQGAAGGYTRQGGATDRRDPYR